MISLAMDFIITLYVDAIFRTRNVEQKFINFRKFAEIPTNEILIVQIINKVFYKKFFAWYS